jgi:MFS superfamily sulfate permease-like transporter
MAGLITGIIGGLVVAWASDSPLSVSGPAAGLTAIVAGAIGALGYEAFLVAVVLAGVMQVGLGFLRAGLIAYYFPSTVIKGLLAAIGAILILKEIPHALGVDKDYLGDLDFNQADGENTLTEIANAAADIHFGAVIIAVLGLAILLAVKQWPKLELKWLPAPLLVVGMGIGLNELFGVVAPELYQGPSHRVQLPSFDSFGDMLSTVPFPDFSAITDPEVWKAAGTIAVIASIETLLCVEAIDKLDPYNRSTPTNRELKAQGLGNSLAGLVGGIPMTAVIVRGSTNVQSGGRTKMSAFIHGVLLAATVVLIPFVLERIPYAALAAVLLHIGYKLAPVSLFKSMYKRGWDQFLPFVITFAAILFTDLLIGVLIGLAAGVFFVLKANLATPYFMHHREVHDEGDESGRPHVRIELSENVSFLNKASVTKALQELPDCSSVEIDGSVAQYIDRDVVEIIRDFARSGPKRGIEVELKAIPKLE